MHRYTVVLEPTNEPDHPNRYYAHIPTLDLTTHGDGIDGAIAAARDLIELWLEELKTSGKVIPNEQPSLVTHIEVAA